MSGLIVGLVLRLQITDTFNSDAKFIATVYADHAWEDGSHAHPAVSTVARITGFSERTVQRYLRMLEQTVLTVDGKGPRGTTQYKFTLRETADGSVGLVVRRGDSLTPPQAADSGDSIVSPRQADGGDTESGDTESGDSIVSPELITRHLKPKEEEEKAPAFKISEALQAELKELGIFVTIWADVGRRISQDDWSESDVSAVIAWMLRTCKNKTQAAQRFVTRLREGTKAPREYYATLRSTAEDESEEVGGEEDISQPLPAGDPSISFSLMTAWGRVLDELSREMPRASFSTYVSKTRPAHFQGDLLEVNTSFPTQAEWLESRLTRRVEQLLLGILNAPVRVKFVVFNSVAVETEVEA